MDFMYNYLKNLVFLFLVIVLSSCGGGSVCVGDCPPLNNATLTVEPSSPVTVFLNTKTNLTATLEGADDDIFWTLGSNSLGDSISSNVGKSTVYRVPKGVPGVTHRGAAVPNTLVVTAGSLSTTVDIVIRCVHHPITCP